MNTDPYIITFWNGETIKEAEVKPCCDVNNVVDYAIYINNQLEFNVTKSIDSGQWVVSLKNADDNIPDEVVQNIGIEIDLRNTEQP